MEIRGRLLIVDDEEPIRDVLAHMVSNSGYACVLAANGTEAVEVLAREEVDLVLADLVMPGMSGLELLEHIRGQPIPVIMITGMNDVRTAVEALHKGAADYLTKPVDRRELLVRIGRALECHRLQREAERARELAAITATTVTASHLINTPLAIIAGHIHMLLNKLSMDPAQMTDHLGEMQGEVDRIGEILRRLQQVKVPAYVPYDKNAIMLDLERQEPASEQMDQGSSEREIPNTPP